MAHAHCMLDTQGYRHTFKMFYDKTKTEKLQNYLSVSTIFSQIVCLKTATFFCFSGGHFTLIPEYVVLSLAT